ncbi:MAG: M48 family metallopeptidase [Lentisphaeria bacterium]
MDFFQYQENARRRTKLLVFYYALAVVLIIGAVYLAVAFAAAYNQAETEPFRYQQLWQPELLIWTAIIIGGIIGLGSFYKITALSGGGKKVAEMMGGSPVAGDTNDPDERKLLNIVEEMAIASGIPVPPVYIIEEPGINAFAAGFQPSDAVIGVTRGSVEKLNRDELQGVIAHEFSHILNGDMRINIRLIGVLFGILLITVIGQVLMRIGFYSGLGGRRRSSSGKNGNGLPFALMLFGLVLLIVGAIGVFFGRLIKSAVSRQREFLADAAAVQFTRNPGGLAGALKKIGASTSKLESTHAEEASHMFFANSLKKSVGGLFATHPPLQERISRLNTETSQAGETSQVSSSIQPQTSATTIQADAGDSQAQNGISQDTAKRIMATIGAMESVNLDRAIGMVESIPESIRTTVRNPAGARAAVLCLLLADDNDIADKQWQCLDETMDDPTREKIVHLKQQIKTLPRTAKLPVIDLAMTALQQQTEEEYRRFKAAVDQLIAADNRVGIFEFALSRSLLHHLEPVFGRPEKVNILYHSIKPVMKHCLPLLALLARYGNEDNPEQAASDFAAGVSALGNDPANITMPEIEEDAVEVFTRELKILRKADDKTKKRIVNACIAAIVGNRDVSAREAELLRAVVDSLDCPLPPAYSAYCMKNEISAFN